jgi:hypothetical protein
MKRLLLKHTFIILHMFLVGGMAAALSWILSVSFADAAVGVLIGLYSKFVIETWEKEE